MGTQRPHYYHSSSSSSSSSTPLLPCPVCADRATVPPAVDSRDLCPAEQGGSEWRRGREEPLDAEEKSWHNTFRPSQLFEGRSIANHYPIVVPHPTSTGVLQFTVTFSSTDAAVLRMLVPELSHLVFGMDGEDDIKGTNAPMNQQQPLQKPELGQCKVCVLHCLSSLHPHQSYTNMSRWWTMSPEFTRSGPVRMMAVFALAISMCTAHSSVCLALKKLTTGEMSTPRSPGGAGATAACQPSSSVESSAHTESDADPRFLLSVTRSSLLARRLLRLRTCRGHIGPVTRRKREMIPANRKDSSYWDKRRKNNEAAKRSREKRRLNDLMLEGQLLALSEENAQLRAHVLSLQYHSSLCTEMSKVASPGVASTPSVVASTLSFPRAAHTPALFQAGHWGSSRGPPASILGVRPQETTSHHFDANINCFGSTKGAVGLNPPRAHNSGTTQQGILPLPGACVISPRSVLEGLRSAEADMDAQRQVSSSDDIPNSNNESSHPASSTRAFVPTSDALHQAPSALAYAPQSWLVPHLSHPAVCNNLLLPWRSSYLPTPAVYPGLPLYIHERQGQALVSEADLQRGLRGRFSSAPAEAPQLGVNLSSDGR
ncbi:hypothetical protein INR49_030302 [Caranx melampygus]|nr:hypothetical protein INR49_030302 [Caranx melampygus]